MKYITSTTLLITICTLVFQSCSKKNDINPPAKGSVVFWTKNAALLTSCSNDIVIRLLVPIPYGSAIPYDTVHIINVNASAPSSCSGTPSANENIHSQLYAYQIKDCVTGLWTGFYNFRIAPGECLKIEIP